MRSHAQPVTQHRPPTLEHTHNGTSPSVHPFQHLPQATKQTDPSSGNRTTNETQTQNAIPPAAASHQRSTISRLPICPSSLPCNQTTHHRARACVHPAVCVSVAMRMSGWMGKGGETRRYLPACMRAWLGLAWVGLAGTCYLML